MFVMTATQLVVEPTMTQIDCDGEQIYTCGFYHLYWWLHNKKLFSVQSWNLLDQSPVRDDTHAHMCTGTEIQQCVQPFVNTYGLQDQTALFADSATRDENAMRQVCRSGGSHLLLFLELSS